MNDSSIHIRTGKSGIKIKKLANCAPEVDKQEKGMKKQGQARFRCPVV